jgi:hypothetical protein
MGPGPIPVSAPIRFMPEYDNVLLGYVDRTRMISDHHRERLGSRIPDNVGTVLVDGSVQATWKIERQHGTAALFIDPIYRLSKRDSAAVSTETAVLLDFRAADADTRDVRLVPTG